LTDIDQPLPGPVAGWRILELADGVSAAFCGRVLADLGADVVMVEPPEGHPLRSAPPRRADGLSGRFVYLAAGKSSVVIDPAGGWMGLEDLIRECDLVVTDRPDLIQRSPDGAVPRPVVFVTPFGLTGPYSRWRGHHLTVFHAAGESSTLPSGLGFELFPDRPPLQLGGDIGHFDAGWNAALVALAVLHDTRSGAHPLTADVSMQESELTLSRTRLNRYLNEGVCVGREKRRYGVTGMLACSDGWIQLVGMRDEHWDALARSEEGALFGQRGLGSAVSRADRSAELGQALAEWCASRPKEDAALALSRLGAPVGIFADPLDCLGSDQLAHRGFFASVSDGVGGHIRVPGAPYRFSVTPTSTHSPPPKGISTGFAARTGKPMGTDGGAGRLLEGIRILDFTWAAAGPYATLLLGFLGAEIVKVESLRRVDPARRGFLGQTYEDSDRSPIFNELNLGKKSLQIDLTQPESAHIMRELIGAFDVVVDNFRPGVMDRLGRGADALLSEHPTLIVASSSANGSTGPEAMGAGLASIFAASGGLSAQTGYEDGPPTEGSDTMDYRSGTALAVAITAALLCRTRTGLGQRVDLSSREVLLSSAPDGVLAADLGVNRKPRVGNGHREMAPHGVFPCADGWLAIAVGDEREWRGLCSALGRHDWVEALAAPEAREEDNEAVDRAISRWTEGLSRHEAAAALQRLGVAAAAVMSFADIAADRHVAERHVFCEVKHPALGTQRVMRAPWRLSESLGPVIRPAPILGANNDEILTPSSHARAVPAERRVELFR
jgi:crotonobetainyl-CoA:carnitine CoA-transferase CaiB-like acyl-CoA transferase